jgi:hypothetical protein
MIKLVLVSYIGFLNILNQKNFIIMIIIISYGQVKIAAQNRESNRDNYFINIKETDKIINIDGLLDEEPWLSAERTSPFNMVLPVDSGIAKAQTVAMVTYDRSSIYVAMICYDPTPGKRIVESLRRDFTFNRNDNCMIFIDTFNDQTNGFVFGVSAAGAQIEGLLYNTTLTAYNWNAKWNSAVKNYDDRWVAEFSIPFRIIRYNESQTIWGVNFGRVDLKTTEKSVWAPVPRIMNSSSLQYTGTLIWDKPLEKAITRFSFIPYVIGKGTRDNQEEEKTVMNANTGFDAKLILSSSMNLDIAINPDYSQVEEDRQVINLDRFELFFPERRNFFLENSDLFANLGNAGARPFFSRRIGLNSPVVGGGRFSGRFGNKWRLGLMNLQTGTRDDIRAANFGVMALQRQVFSRSNITGFFINKQLMEELSYSAFSNHNYNRVAGLEYNLSSSNSKWTGKALYHQAFYPGSGSDAAIGSGRIEYLTQQLRISMDMTWIGSDFIAETGYIRRNGFFEATPGFKYSIYTRNKESKVLYHGLGLDFDAVFDPQHTLTDRLIDISYSVNWKSRSVLSFKLSEDFVKLNRSFDPTNSGGELLISGSEFKWRSAHLNYTSDARKVIFISLSGIIGNYYNGQKASIGGSLNYSFQPYGSVALTASYDNISLPFPYNSAELVLVGPRIDVTFTDKVFLTAFYQFNNQIDNMNTNIRFQWRFAPASDLFIIYTGNSTTGDLMNKNRGIAIKMNYWFN